MKVWSGINEGDFYSLYVCEICASYYEKNIKEFVGEEIYEGHFLEFDDFKQFKKAW